MKDVAKVDPFTVSLMAAYWHYADLPNDETPYSVTFRHYYKASVALALMHTCNEPINVSGHNEPVVMTGRMVSVLEAHGIELEAVLCNRPETPEAIKTI